MIILLRLVAGIALLADRPVPLALVVYAAMHTTSLNFYFTMDPGGSPPDLTAIALWIVAARGFRRDLRGLPATQAAPAPVRQAPDFAQASHSASRSKPRKTGDARLAAVSGRVFASPSGARSKSFQRQKQIVSTSKEGVEL